jgi:putative pyruvate formate lyase activating enzyme
MHSDAAGTPGYQRLSAAEFDRRVEQLWERYDACDLCPHACGVDRTAGERGACGCDDTALVASAFPHHGEEACLRGHGGSGTVFLAGCPLSCVFCQNADISQQLRGDPATPADIAEMALDLQRTGCHNVNFVTPTHVAPHLVKAVRIASDRGLDLPIVWNCGGYESVAVLELLDGIVDVYMPDLKWSDDDLARTYSHAPDYWAHAREALREMHRQVGDLAIEDGIATRGLLVRHLVMPGHVENSKGVLDFLADLSTATYVNVMSQYRPAHEVPGSDRYAAIDRRLDPAEYRAVVEYGRSLGLPRLDVDSRLV